MDGEAAKYNVVVSQSIMREHGDHKKVAVWRGKSRYMWSMVNSQKTLFTYGTGLHKPRFAVSV